MTFYVCFRPNNGHLVGMWCGLMGFQIKPNFMSQSERGRERERVFDLFYFMLSNDWGLVGRRQCFLVTLPPATEQSYALQPTGAFFFSSFFMKILKVNNPIYLIRMVIFSRLVRPE